MKLKVGKNDICKKTEKEFNSVLSQAEFIKATCQKKTIYVVYGQEGHRFGSRLCAVGKTVA